MGKMYVQPSLDGMDDRILVKLCPGKVDLELFSVSFSMWVVKNARFRGNMNFKLGCLMPI